MATKVVKNYGSGELKDISVPNALHEAKLLMLDISKAKFRLGWEPRMDIDQTMGLTVDWYKNIRKRMYMIYAWSKSKSTLVLEFK